ncbi:MAG: amidohydrolase [Hyphomicrobiales bacterium]|nr:amidohydrolase [Hyphomicrobiales bacterium]
MPDSTHRIDVARNDAPRIEVPRIDVHCHSMPAAYRQALTNLGPTIRTPAWSAQGTVDFLDRHGIAAAVLSLSVPGAHLGDDAAARVLARRCNEEAAAWSERYPSRLGAFATLPIPDMQAACEEACHALDVFKLDGVGLLASYQGTYLGDPAFDPVFEVLNERSAVVLVHPNNHPSTRLVREGISKGIGNFLVEFLFDTTRAALNLLYWDCLHRFPNIRFILCHAGGTLPYVSWRVAEITARQMTVPPWDTQYPSPFMQRHAGAVTPELVLSQLRHFWYETALSAGPQTMGSLRAVAAPERILFGSDWPYCPEDMTEDMTRALDAQTSLDPGWRAAIARDNALQLFPRFSG